MKLLRYGQPGREKPAILDARGDIRDLSSVIPDLSGNALEPESLDRLRAIDLSSLPRVDDGVRLGPCVAGVGRFICSGFYYSDHGAVSVMAVRVGAILLV